MNGKNLQPVLKIKGKTKLVFFLSVKMKPKIHFIITTETLQMIEKKMPLTSPKSICDVSLKKQMHDHASEFIKLLEHFSERN